MRSIFKYIIPFLIIILLFKFIGFIFQVSIKFWYIVLPLAIYYYVSSKIKMKKREFKNRTHLYPEKEVKLKKEVEIEDD